MKAAVLYGKEDVRIEEIEAPPLRAGEVRVLVEAALTCGTDFKVFKRGYHARMIVPPAVFGHELAGVINEVAPDATGWRVGDRVTVANSAPCDRCFFCERSQQNLCDDLLFLNGAYAEFIVVPSRLVEKNLLRLQPQTEFRDAALTEPLACVVQGSEECDLMAGQTLLVIGSGPIGLMSAVLAKTKGCHVTLLGRGKSRLALARHLAIDHIIDVEADPDFSAARSGSAAKGFDVVIEAVGKPDTWQSALRLVRKGGLVNFLGGCPSGSFVPLDTELVHYSSLTLKSTFHHTPGSIRTALNLIEHGVIRAADFVDGQCSLSRLPDLFKSFAAGNRAVKTLVQVRE